MQLACVNRLLNSERSLPTTFALIEQSSISPRSSLPMRVACTGLTLDLSSAANGMSRLARLKCWLQPWTFLCQSCSRGSYERRRVRKSSRRRQQHEGRRAVPASRAEVARCARSRRDRHANSGQPLPESVAAKFHAMLKICAALRDHIKALPMANLESWKTAHQS
jgi:hypothetical protein